MELRKGFDNSILLLAVVLTCFGVVMVYSSSSIMAAKRYADGFHFLKRQGLFAVAGMLIMVAAMHVDYHRLRKFAVPFLLFCFALLVAVLIPGIGSNAGGASRWIRLGGFNVQPAELAKIALVVYMAHSLSKKKEKIKSFKLGFIPYMVVLAALLALLLKQPDLGSAMTLGGVAMVMLLVAGARLSYLVSLVILALPFLYFLVMNVDYRRKRILAFLNPWEDPTNTGFQIIQSWIAFGTGGLFGNGLGEGKQKLFFLPEAHTDFIFAVVGEELGYAGVLVISAMFLVLVMRGMRTALHAPDDFGRYLAFGLTLLLGLEAFVNIAVVLGMLPTKGLALPFLSYGGTSLFCTLGAVGVLLNISSQAPGEVR
ncbi:putative lipid II flippase FtsW [Desulfuromonas versatilis]|uniref:Probable peptidoglycan glycosyltransferase FtsW n=1 Tax=Desulfuromonas versatilis TaxID=2802975 RepID=A0ABM8HTD6_9BACT|nr:putative lipid II flippase FtsW [Desulfuromonas versatilis]BCR03961.1 putative lipid II flippase FtsW [Desulfuromonas versatilis]